MQWSQASLFNKWSWDSWTSTCRSVNLDRDLAPLTKLNSEWIINRNVKHKTLNLLEDNTGENLDDFEYDDAFLRYNTKDTICERNN